MKFRGYTFFEKVKTESVKTESAITESATTEVQSQQTTAEPHASVAYGRGYSGTIYPIRTERFDGEKTRGELGSPINLIPDHQSLRVRAFEADLKSDIIRIITGRFFKYVIGNGLKLQSEPNEAVLKMEGIEVNTQEFKSQIENRFKVWSKSKHSDFAKMANVHAHGRDGFRTAFLGGDFLTVLRVENNLNITVQVIDGQEIQTPYFGEFADAAKARGNKIKHGIEVDKTGQHIAFYVLVENDLKNGEMFKFERIEARAKNGVVMAYMVYGSKHRMNHYRGVPQITAILEKVEKLDRYTEASVGSAEERAKIVYAVEHNRFSNGENPLVEQMREQLNIATEENAYQQGAALSETIAQTTSKQTFNMPIGAQLKALESQIESNYDGFFKAVFNTICASVDVPPEVALQMYNSNYSASRAAQNAWEHILNTARSYYGDQFYKPIYDLFLLVEIIKNKISANGYLQALADGNFMITESYSMCKWTGVKLPHIDPKKEMDAIRIALGDEATALISYEQAVEMLGFGEWGENFRKFLEEQKTIPKPPIEENAANSQNNPTG